MVKKISFQSSILSIKNLWFTTIRISKEGTELLNDLMNRINSSLIEKFDHEYDSARKINMDTSLKCSQRAVMDVFPVEFRKLALAEGQRKLMLHQWKSQEGGKEACNGEASEKNEENEEAPSGGDQSEQNGGSENDAGQADQDGDAAGEENNESDKADEEAGKEDENATAEATDSENAESREKNDEEVAE